MKYQQLHHLESGWKWSYLMKCVKEGRQVTCHADPSQRTAALQALEGLGATMEAVNAWITTHLSAATEKKMEQAIRARRKRYFNAEHKRTRKKSIDLEYPVWEALAQYARLRGETLSETISSLLLARPDPGTWVVPGGQAFADPPNANPPLTAFRS